MCVWGCASGEILFTPFSVAFWRLLRPIFHWAPAAGGPLSHVNRAVLNKGFGGRWIIVTHKHTGTHTHDFTTLYCKKPEPTGLPALTCFPYLRLIPHQTPDPKSFQQCIYLHCHAPQCHSVAAVQTVLCNSSLPPCQDSVAHCCYPGGVLPVVPRTANRWQKSIKAVVKTAPVEGDVTSVALTLNSKFMDSDIRMKRHPMTQLIHVVINVSYHIFHLKAGCNVH